MPCFSCLTTATRARSRQKIQKIFFSLAAWVGDSQRVMNSPHTAPVSAEWICLLSPDLGHTTADRKREPGFFLAVLAIRHNAKDSWGQQSLKLRLCKAAKKQMTEKQVEKIPALSHPTAALNCSQLSLSPDFSSQNSECLWIPLTFTSTYCQPENVWYVFLCFSISQVHHHQL